MPSNPSWDAYNEFLMHGRLDRVTKILARYELFKRVVELPGDIVEGGVFRGTGVLYWAKLMQIFNPLSQRKVVGFDTFAGYPDSDSAHEKESGQKFVADAGTKATSMDEILGAARDLGLAQRVELIAGDATRTIEEYVRNNPGFRVALLNLDFDTHDPTAAALRHLYLLVVPGGVVVFDEYATRGWGESDAVDNFFRDQKMVLRSIPWAMSPSAYAVKES